MSGLTDRELLEGAARAAGLRIWEGRNTTGMHPEMNALAAPYWRPLSDDGDAIRLLHAIYRKTSPDHWIRVYNNIWSGSLEDMRRAVVRAAYEIGSAKP